MLTAELLAYLFDDQPHLLREPLSGWLASSRRFAAFTTTFRDKIRKKIRTTPAEENLLDLQLELETAYRLLQERKLSVEYEPQPLPQSRCPDFAVTYTTSLTFTVEVTRLRVDLQSTPAGERLADTVADKLGQLLPQHSNVLVAGVEGSLLTADELRTAMIILQQRAERGDDTFLRRYRFRDRAYFFRHYRRLSEVLVRGLGQSGETAVWVNPQATHPLPARVRTPLYRSQAEPTL